ncbi:hypothetical protein JL107_04865 [Nakamurella flavida]|uniref:Uncharacterized protein n=1 Tax=Nakamurella flavida TaxID=363630 RepID=A0A939C520_9ACTN|nr:hypothetical protein [Nakamurella flavida]MBM9475772.1 hypothetical protein [Nakamurella flavida]MDP9777948.1 hypothetical protein [Nakamurella flavida]
MLIAGRDRWRIRLDEPAALQIALYVRDVAGLRPEIRPEIPALDPPATVWPVWVRRPSGTSRPAPTVDPTSASEQWAGWWTHLLLSGQDGFGDLRPPAFPALAGSPALRELVRHHWWDAEAWTDGLHDDPRRRRDLSGPWRALGGLVQGLEDERGGTPADFRLRVTVLPVAGKRGWVLRPDHLLVTRALIADQDNALDWLRMRIRPLL